MRNLGFKISIAWYRWQRCSPPKQDQLSTLKTSQTMTGISHEYFMHENIPRFFGINSIWLTYSRRNTRQSGYREAMKPSWLISSRGLKRMMNSEATGQDWMLVMVCSSQTPCHLASLLHLHDQVSLRPHHIKGIARFHSSPHTPRDGITVQILLFFWNAFTHPHRTSHLCTLHS